MAVRLACRSEHRGVTRRKERTGCRHINDPHILVEHFDNLSAKAQRGARGKRIMKRLRIICDDKWQRISSRKEMQKLAAKLRAWRNGDPEIAIAA